MESIQILPGWPVCLSSPEIMMCVLIYKSIFIMLSAMVLHFLWKKCFIVAPDAEVFQKNMKQLKIR